MRHSGVGQEVVDWLYCWKALFLKKKSSFKMLGFSFSSQLDWGSNIVSIAKTASKKVESFIHSVKFLSGKVVL